ncbi:MAG: LamG-like jellyroll fold domain-containing protein, partial [Chryseobacterium sp.]
MEGCPFGGYFSTQSSTLPAATATGNLTVRPWSIVTKINYDKNTKKATGVEVLDGETNKTYTFNAKIVFLNASALNSAWVLMNSATDVWENGLGSSSAGITGASTTTIANTAALKIKGTGFTIPEAITINGAGINSFGAIYNPTGLNTLIGQITLASASTIVSGTVSGTTADSLLITSGGINTGSYILTTGVVKGMRIDAVISGTGGLTKINNDTLILGGTNIYSGLTTLSAGVIEAKNSAAFGTNLGATTMTSGTTIQLEGNNLIIPEPITINGNGVVVSFINQGAIKNTRNINKWTGIITLGSASTIVSTGTSTLTTVDSLIVESGGIVLSSYTLTTDVVKGMRIDGVISGTGGLTKISGDTLILGGANSYSGATSLNAGVIQLQNQDGLGSTSPGANSTTASNTTVALGSFIKIIGSGFIIPESLIVSGTGVANRGAIYNKSNKNTLSGAITFGADASFYSDGTSTSDSLILSGAINTGTVITPIVTSSLVLNLDAGIYTPTSSTWVDQGLYANNATLPAALVSSYSPTVGGGSFNFQKSSTYTIRNGLTNSWNINSAQGMTIETWIKYTSTAADQFWFSDPYGLYKFGLNAAGKQLFRLSYDGLSADYTGSDVITAGTWQHIVYTGGFESPGVTSTRIYINGQPESGNPYSTGSSFSALAPGYYIGNGADVIYPLNGNMGLIRVYNKVLTSSEVSTNYNALKSRFIDGMSTSSNMTINSVKGVRISGVISGAGQVTKIGLDSLVLTGTYSSTGKVNINEGAVKLGAANIINDSTDINFNGGVLSTNNDEIVRKLYLSNSSTLKLGASAHQISFVGVDTLLNKK